MKSISIFFMAIILVPMLSWSQGNAPIDTSESIVKNPTESTLEENEEYEEVYEYEENYAPSQKLVYKDPFGPEWEKKHMIAKGFKIGLVTTRGLILKNVVNDVKLSSGMLTGFEIGYAYIPKVNQLGFFKSVASLGFKTRFYSLSGSFNEDPILFDKDFSISGIDLDLTYSVYPKTFIYVGFNSPIFTVSGEEKLFGPIISLDFDSTVGLNMGLGYEFSDDILLELQISRHSYDVKREVPEGYQLKGTANIAKVEYTLTNLALSYTF